QLAHPPAWLDSTFRIGIGCLRFGSAGMTVISEGSGVLAIWSIVGCPAKFCSQSARYTSLHIHRPGSIRPSALVLAVSGSVQQG
ncbi:hypothetical protein ACLXAS_25795, partial [Escherichia coli]